MAALTKERGHGRRGRGAGKGVALALALLLSAYLMAVAVGTAGHPWLAWTSLIPLFIAIRWLHPLFALGSGVFWGAGLFFFSTTVVPSQVPTSLPALLLFLLVPGLYAGLGAWLSRLIGFHPLVLGVAWMGVELALKPLGLHHGLLAATQSDGALIHWVGGAMGYVFVAFLVAYANAVLFWVVSDGRLGSGRRAVVAAPDNPPASLIAQMTTCLARSFSRIWQPRAPPFTFATVET